MQKPANYDNVEAKQMGVNDNPPAGGYILKIVSAKEKNSQKGRPMLELFLDIASGDYAGHYEKLSQRLSKPAYMRHYIMTDEDSAPFLKGFIQSVEESNRFVFDFSKDVAQLDGLKIGASLRYEEYQAKDGTIKETLRTHFLCPIGTIEKIKPAKTKTLQPSLNNFNAMANEIANKEEFPF